MVGWFLNGPVDIFSALIVGRAVVSFGALREENIRDVFRALVFESDDADIQFN